MAALLAEGPDPIPDPGGAEQMLLDLTARGEVERIPLGQDALWKPARSLGFEPWVLDNSAVREDERAGGADPKAGPSRITH